MVKSEDFGNSGKDSGSGGQPGIQRGDIFWAEFAGSAAGSSGGKIPALVVQNNTGNRYGATVIVSPITSTLSRKAYPTNVVLPRGLLSRPAEARMSHVITIEKARLGSRIGRLPEEKLAEVDKALLLSLGLKGSD